MNFYGGLTGGKMIAPQNVTECPRCKGLIQMFAPRSTINGKVYHAYCSTKLEVQDESLLQQDIGDRPVIPTK